MWLPRATSFCRSRRQRTMVRYGFARPRHRRNQVEKGFDQQIPFNGCKKKYLSLLFKINSKPDHFYCLVICFFLGKHFAKKNIFCVIISRLQRFFPNEYRFMPDSFLLPDEIYDLELHMRHFPYQTFIAKPSKGRGGEGITLVKKFQDLPKNAFSHEFLVQRYIENPLLINHKKFDIRLYVVIKGVDPIEAYLCEEGLARFCTVSFYLVPLVVLLTMVLLFSKIIANPMLWTWETYTCISPISAWIRTRKSSRSQMHSSWMTTIRQSNCSQIYSRSWVARGVMFDT